MTKLKEKRYKEILEKLSRCYSVEWLSTKDRQEGEKLRLEKQQEDLNAMTNEELYIMHDTPLYTCKIDKENKSWTDGILIYRGKKYNIPAGKMEQNGPYVYDNYIYWHKGQNYFDSTKKFWGIGSGIGGQNIWQIAKINRDGFKCELWVDEYPSIYCLSNSARFSARKEIEKRAKERE